MKRILYWMLCLALAFSTCAAHSESAAQLVVNRDIFLREGPGEEYAPLVSVPSGSKTPYMGIGFSSIGEAWYLTAFNGITGYAPSSTVEPYAPSTEFRVLDHPSAQANRRVITAGWTFGAALLKDGTVATFGNNEFGQRNVGGWRDIVSLSAGAHHLVGLRSDGTVVAAGNNNYGQCEVDKWQKIVAVSAGVYHTVGLRSDGTVIAVGDQSRGQCNVSDWKDIHLLAAGTYYTVGFTSRGQGCAVGIYDDSSPWNGTPEQDIKYLKASPVSLDASYFFCGVNDDGTVFLKGQTHYRAPIDISPCKKVKSVAAGGAHIVLLNQAGAVYAMGANGYEQSNVDTWTGMSNAGVWKKEKIVALAAGSQFSVGLYEDGTLTATGRNENGQCDVGTIRDVQMP